MQAHACDYMDEIADLKEAIEEEQTTKESLEETFVQELSNK
jgi:cell division protein FtsL